MKKLNPIKDINPQASQSARKLVEALGEAGGFTAKKVAVGLEIFEAMIKHTGCVKFLSFTADICATGTRGAIIHLVKNKLVDVIITTCGTLDHDISRSAGPYFHGDFRLDDAELHKTGFHRLGNILINQEKHGPAIEDFVRPILDELFRSGVKNISTRDLCWKLGEKLKDDTILYWAWKNKIPVFVPGITDGAVGSQLWQFSQNPPRDFAGPTASFSQNHDFKVDVLADEKEIAKIIFEAKTAGALMLGGGISKHHVIWWNQFRDGLDYAVQISTAPEWDGSLSGAQTREAISWGKLKAKAKHVTIEGDVTIILPLIVAALSERL
ncbi:MAG: deoxyhypusine synthase [DPANN group archaeon]|nr:deoxyhypusine synthase [DPANN group archaeon]